MPSDCCVRLKSEVVGCSLLHIHNILKKAQIRFHYSQQHKRLDVLWNGNISKHGTSLTWIVVYIFGWVCVWQVFIQEQCLYNRERYVWLVNFRFEFRFRIKKIYFSNIIVIINILWLIRLNTWHLRLRY